MKRMRRLMFPSSIQVISSDASSRSRRPLHRHQHHRAEQREVQWQEKMTRHLLPLHTLFHLEMVERRQAGKNPSKCEEGLLLYLVH